mgnify:CR=1 FL=1
MDPEKKGLTSAHDDNTLRRLPGLLASALDKRCSAFAIAGFTSGESIVLAGRKKAGAAD